MASSHPLAYLDRNAFNAAPLAIFGVGFVFALTDPFPEAVCSMFVYPIFSTIYNIELQFTFYVLKIVCFTFQTCFLGVNICNNLWLRWIGWWIGTVFTTSTLFLIYLGTINDVRRFICTNQIVHEMSRCEWIIIFTFGLLFGLTDPVSEELMNPFLVYWKITWFICGLFIFVSWLPEILSIVKYVKCNFEKITRERTRVKQIQEAALTKLTESKLTPITISLGIDQTVNNDPKKLKQIMASVKQYDKFIYEDDPTCAICTLDMFDSNREFSYSVCTHAFHTTCLTDWKLKSFTGRFTCPLCRATISILFTGSHIRLPKL